MSTSSPTPSPLQTLSTTYQSLQTSLQTLITARQKLESQQQENQSVQKEFSSLPPPSQIYKLVGPVLLAQERSEAVMAVEGRLEFIEKEMYGATSPTPPPLHPHRLPLPQQHNPSHHSIPTARLTTALPTNSKRIEAQIQDIQTKSEGVKMEVYRMQSQMSEG